MSVVRRARSELVSDTDLARAKADVLTGEAFSKETLSDRAASIALDELYGLGGDEAERFRKAVNDLDARTLRLTALEKSFGHASPFYLAPVQRVERRNHFFPEKFRDTRKRRWTYAVEVNDVEAVKQRRFQGAHERVRRRVQVLGINAGPVEQPDSLKGVNTAFDLISVGRDGTAVGGREARPAKRPHLVPAGSQTRRNILDVGLNAAEAGRDTLLSYHHDSKRSCHYPTTSP